MEEAIAGEEDMVCAINTSLPTIQIISWVEHTMKPKNNECFFCTDAIVSSC